jgi:hypothetical protein
MHHSVFFKLLKYTGAVFAQNATTFQKYSMSFEKYSMSFGKYSMSFGGPNGEHSQIHNSQFIFRAPTPSDLNREC